MTTEEARDLYGDVLTRVTGAHVETRRCVVADGPAARPEDGDKLRWCQEMLGLDLADIAAHKRVLAHAEGYRARIAGRDAAERERVDAEGRLRAFEAGEEVVDGRGVPMTFAALEAAAAAALRDARRARKAPQELRALHARYPALLGPAPAAE